MNDSRSFTLSTPSGLVTIGSSPETGPLASRRQKPHVDFLTEAWVGLSAAAWTGFSEHGAGAVVLWRDAAPKLWRPRAFEPERLWYATSILSIPSAGRDHFDSWEAQQLETYDPRRQALVVFAEGARLQSYTIQGIPAPPEAIAIVRARLN